MGWLDRLLGKAADRFVDVTQEVRLRVALTQRLPELVAAQHWDEARLMLRKLAYTSKQQPQQAQRDIAAAILAFAPRDPLYLEWVGVVRRVLAEVPGILQAEMKREFLDELSTQDADYVLHFAEELGEIRRAKRGSSYALFLADQPG